MREGFDVGRGEAEFPAPLGAAYDDALDAVRTAQDLAGARHVALGDQPPGQGGGERLAAARLAAHVQVDDLDLEVVRLALLGQEGHVPRGLVAEAEVGALDDRLGVQLVDEHLDDEIGLTRASRTPW